MPEKPDIKRKMEFEKPSKSDLKYIEWGFDLYKQRLDFANNYLQHLITLNVAIIGVYITFVDKKIVNFDFGKLIVLCFFLSLLISFGGSLPYDKKTCLDCPSQIKKVTEDSFNRKRICIWVSSISFFIGFVLLSLAVLGLL